MGAQPLPQLAQWKKVFGLKQHDLAHLLRIQPRTLQRWLHKETERPNAAHLEQIDAVDEILDEALHALAKDQVGEWFRTPNSVLGDLRPLDLMSSRSGRERIKALLVQIRWGIPT